MKKQKLVIATGLLTILAISVTSSLAFFEAEAEEVTPFPSREKTISVSGIATAQVDPDILNVQFGVETQEKTAKAALESNSALMNQVVNAIKTAGITDDEIGTRSLTIQPIYDYYRDERGRNTQELIGYRVSNVVIVDTKNLSLASSIIDGAVEAGANRVDSVSFTLAPETQQNIKDDLIGKAVLNAKSKAQKALTPLEHKIIGVKSVSLSEFAIPYPMPVFKADFAMAESMAAPTPIFTSDQDVSTTAHVVFIIGSN